MQLNSFKFLSGVAMGCLLMSCASENTAMTEENTEDHSPAVAMDIPDPYVRGSDALSPDRTPPHPSKDSYGMDPETGIFKHPAATPEQHDSQDFEGKLDYWDANDYAHNMKVEAYYPITVEPFHTWQNIVDFDGRRYMYQYVRRDLKIFDITNPKDIKVLLTRGAEWGPHGPANEETNPYPEDEMFGAATIQWSEAQNAYVMVQAYEIRRFGLLSDKRTQPKNVEAIRKSPHLKGFKVYRMDGPMPDDWTLLAERTTDLTNPDAPIGNQQGSGVRDIPQWTGGKYMFVAAAPDDNHALTEYPNDLYSAGYQAWDMSNPADPKFVGSISMPGQILGNPEDEAIFAANPRAGNRTSWFGARMSLFIPTPVDEGGKYGFAAMGGLGFYVVDISDPANMNIISHLDFPPSVAGTEGDYIDISQYHSSGLIYYSGYPLNEDCWEPYKDVYILDVNDPENPKNIGVLPRPTAPEDAPYTDYCQRGGSFGPKRTGYYHQPGVSREGILPFNFYNAGLQVFDATDPKNPEIAAYFVPRFDEEKVPGFAMGNLSHSVYVEYDRNLFWLFVNHGIYLLSSPLLGEPSFDMPEKAWPPRS
ncbi:LVIVD repeat-containing protein [Pseudemcibacter aquimaris]|uniref:LVIVD repeat-containing protein n=1 Tax=Pseudemcibacter aquimaris TaxID=2857064 RepID=UPI002010EF96|nr:hypothetical protein [Pseudemcibacter aquimaris]MCC3862403.1 hypothetical protein [Pseudemcibacter aquimaris]WDU59167.1 hypothetical protein KW060_02650 [Pseudemcibacter aquimaris]